MISIFIITVAIVNASIALANTQHLLVPENRLNNREPTGYELDSLIAHGIDGGLYLHNVYCTVVKPFGRPLWIKINDTENVLTFKFEEGREKESEVIELPFIFLFYNRNFKRAIVSADGNVVLCNRCTKDETTKPSIMPLMINFNWNAGLAKNIRAYTNDERLTVQWENMTVSDQPGAGNFSFQMSIFSDGAIVFFYKNVPNDEAVLNRARIEIQNTYDDNPKINDSQGLPLLSDEKIDIFKEASVKSRNVVIYLPQSTICWKSRNCRQCNANNFNGTFPKCFWCNSDCFTRCEGILHIWEGVKNCYADMVHQNYQRCNETIPDLMPTEATSAMTTTKASTQKTTTMETIEIMITTETNPTKAGVETTATGMIITYETYIEKVFQNVAKTMDTSSPEGEMQFETTPSTTDSSNTESSSEHHLIAVPVIIIASLIVLATASILFLRKARNSITETIILADFVRNDLDN